jgi:integrase
MAKRIYSKKNNRLYQHKEGGNYYCRQGQTEICLETPDHDQAEENLKLQDALNTRFGTKAFKFKVKDLFPKFLKAKEKELRPRTRKLYQIIWEVHFEKRLGKLYIGNMNQRAWSKFCAEAETINDFQNPRNLMTHFLKWCAAGEFILAIPVLSNPKHKRRKRKIIPPVHLALIFQRAHGSLLLFCAMAVLMGMRRDEIMGLSWKRIDLEGRNLLLGDEDVKTDDGRHIPISAAVHTLLVERLQAQQAAGLKSEWVFPNTKHPKRRAAPESLMNSWRRCLLHCALADKVQTPDKKRKYKIVVYYTWHDFRATYEKYSHKSKDFTDTQKEKMVGADMDVQKKIYVNMDADDLRGLEEIVSLQVPELSNILTQKTKGQMVQVGNAVETEILKISEREPNP